MEELYKNYCLLVNYFYPSMKLLKKERLDKKIKKEYDKAKSPFVRTLESNDLTKVEKQKLIDKKQQLDLLKLKNKVNEL